MSFSEFALTMQEKEIQPSNRKATKLAAKLLRLESEKDKKIKMDTGLNILSSSPSAQSVTVTDLESNTTTTYPSARKPALALQVSNSTIMNKLNGKNTLAYKNRYLITRFEPK